MKINKLKILLFSILFCPLFSLAQNIQTIENDLLKSLKRIDDFGYLSRKTEETAFDSLVAENKILKEKILKYALANKEILTYNFPKLKDFQFYKATSPDKTFCIFSWNLQTGGSMQFYDNVFVYEQYGKMYTYTIEKDEGTPGGFYSEIFQLTDELNTFYLGYENRILSGRDCYQAINVFDFEREEFNTQYSKIKTKSGFTNKLGFSYNFFSVEKHKERPVKLIFYNKTLQTLSIPVVDTKGSVTSKTIIYKYNGDYFVKQPSKK